MRPHLMRLPLPWMQSWLVRPSAAYAFGERIGEVGDRLCAGVCWPCFARVEMDDELRAQERKRTWREHQRCCAEGTLKRHWLLWSQLASPRLTVFGTYHGVMEVLRMEPVTVAAVRAQCPSHLRAIGNRDRSRAGAAVDREARRGADRRERASDADQIS